jgi:hypothetical protein
MTLCGRIPNDADCMYCPDSYECNLVQEEEKRFIDELTKKHGKGI